MGFITSQSQHVATELASVEAASKPFPDAWREQGLRIAVDGRPHRPNGEFASRREVCAYLASLLVDQLAEMALAAEVPEMPLLSQRQRDSRSRVPREIATVAFYDEAAASMQETRAPSDIFASTTKARQQTSAPRPSLSRINLGGSWTTKKRTARSTRRRQPDAQRG